MYGVGILLRIETLLTRFDDGVVELKFSPACERPIFF